MQQENVQVCLTCGHEDCGNYCSNCGERLTPKRISWGEMLSDYWGDTLAFDTPFLNTVKNLIKRPGHFAHDYVEGKRTGFSKPVHYYLLLLALNYLVIVYLFDFQAVMDSSFTGNEELSQAQIDSFNSFIEDLTGYQKLLTFMQLPFLAFFSWLLFRKTGHNYLENFVFVLFVGGTQLLFNTVPAAITSFLPIPVSSPISMLVTIGMVVYFVWALYQFKRIATASAVFKAISVYLLTLVTYSAIVIGITYSMYEGDFNHLINAP